jgi:IclR family transcriptional regulator, KDG regulon repressor
MVQVILKSFDILELVAQRNGQAISLTEISQELQLNQATTANIINTMVDRGYLEHIGKKKGYRLGMMAFRLTNEVAYEQDMINAAKEDMEQLTASINESSLLGILRNNKRYIIHVVNSTQDIQVQIRSERSVYETASGRLLLAYLSEKELERFLTQNGLPDFSLWEEAGSINGLVAALAQIKKDAFALTHLKNRHVKGFAVPIFVNEKVVAGLSVFVPEYRCIGNHESDIIDSIKKTAQSISQKLIK